MPTWWEELLHVFTGRTSAHSALPDLRALPTDRTEVVGTHFVVNDRERRSTEDRLYVLRHQPHTRRDKRIGVYSHGRGVGFLPPATARRISDHLLALGGAAVVNGAGPAPGSLRLRVDVPTPTSLARFAASQ